MDVLTSILVARGITTVIRAITGIVTTFIADIMLRGTTILTIPVITIASITGIPIASNTIPMDDRMHALTLGRHGTTGNGIIKIGIIATIM